MYRIWLLVDPRRALPALYAFLGLLAVVIHLILLSSNRFNVATTRPRHKLIVLCSNAVLDVVPQDREVLLEAMMLKEFRNFCDGGMRVFTLETGEYGPVEFSVQWKGFAQLETPGSSAS